ncbi:MAG: type II toxin-antitoxin system VapC family toxin [Eggerthellaceae bacterium]|nr:type II toxin-antitoxin system VapC family toxin [Eggerthellaceae bacterium]
MFVLDTNTISELMKENPSESVVAWIGECKADELYTTTITQAEIGYGILRLADGKRKNALQDAYADIFGNIFAARVFPFDFEAAPFYSRITADAERNGKPISVLDAQIAAICACRKATLVTRNIKDFTSVRGLILVNPWDCLS